MCGVSAMRREMVVGEVALGCYGYRVARVHVCAVFCGALKAVPCGGVCQ